MIGACVRNIALGMDRKLERRSLGGEVNAYRTLPAVRRQRQRPGVTIDELIKAVNAALNGCAG
ncbi:MAG: hypothetical protein A3J75_05540 [Acidobacteria bacterium RBG_16_68_9]|nr:MAG: hypothetical protein A3J75_05540 [Acidobacteria bacterium RBG_16_68_9]